jgi:hypothetical protein
MPLYKFGVGDVFYNSVKTHPSSSFFIYDSKIYLNKTSTQTGAFVDNVPGVPTGHVSLLELNVDRASTSTGRVIGTSSSVGSENVPDTGIIFPWVAKTSQGLAPKTYSRLEYTNDYALGDILTGSYQLSASIVRQLFAATDGFNDSHPTGSAIKNSLDYAKRLGQHYNFASGSSVETNLIKIPSIFYGSEIKKGSVQLDFFITGTLVGRLRDSRYDGALIQESGTITANDGKIAGVVLYNEGFVILTGSWNLNTGFNLNDATIDSTAVNSNPRWVRFGMGANDNVSAGSSLTNGSASYDLQFAGTHRIPTVTMLAHASRGELNYSNNPTYIEYQVNTASYNPITASYLYSEREMTITNINSASYADPTGSLKKTTYITKVGIYDDKKRLIGIASVARPVKKTEERDLTFKLKMDI